MDGRMDQCKLVAAGVAEREHSSPPCDTQGQHSMIYNTRGQHHKGMSVASEGLYLFEQGCQQAGPLHLPSHLEQTR